MGASKDPLTFTYSQQSSTSSSSSSPTCPSYTKKKLYERSSFSSLTLWLTISTILLILGVVATGSFIIYLKLQSNLENHQNQDTYPSPTSSSSSSRNHRVIINKFEGKDEMRSVNSIKTERRNKRSPLVSSSSSFVEGSTGPAKLMYLRRYEDDFNEITDGTCRKRSLAMCAGQVPFNSTTYPNFIGDDNEIEASRSLPYFNYIAKSRCNRRIKQLLCSFLEPQCDSGRPIPPCKKFCRIALEGCTEFIPQTLELSSAFDCRRYPDSTDPRVCVNLAMGNKCASDEFQCPDRSCIPRHWVCDGVRDCIFAADEANCNTVACSSEEFQCDRKCVPASWRCDGDRDCLDGTDELNCSYRPGCGPDRFKCADGFGCIPKRWVCDGKAECRDGSDEIGCSQKECTRGDFKCDNGICIPNIWVCDGQDDCKDNSDEKSCSGSSHHSSSSSSSSGYLSPVPSNPIAAAASYSMATYTMPPQPQPQPQPQPLPQPQQQQAQQQQTIQPVYFQSPNYYTRQPVYSTSSQPTSHQVLSHRSSAGHSGYSSSYSVRPSYHSVNPFFGNHNHIYRYFFK